MAQLKNKAFYGYGYNYSTLIGNPCTLEVQPTGHGRAKTAKTATTLQHHRYALVNDAYRFAA